MSKSSPSVLIATPAYGGMVTTDYVRSLLDTVAVLQHEGINFQVYTLANESLIPRGRNQCAWFSMCFGPDGNPYDKLFFIDADMGWEPEQFKQLLFSDKRIIGGVYPIKQYPIELAANALPRDTDIFDGQVRDVASFKKLRDRYNDPKHEIEMLHIPTGFMKIDTSVFADLIEGNHVNSYIGRNWQTKENVMMWDFFPIGTSLHPDAKLYESEDWAFCSLVKKHLDEKIWCNASIITRHTGTHVFKAGHI